MGDGDNTRMTYNIFILCIYIIVKYWLDNLHPTFRGRGTKTPYRYKIYLGKLKM